MDQPITLGMLFWPAVAILGTLGVLGVLVFILSIIAEGFKH